MREYIDIVRHVMMYGTQKSNRTGVDTISTFNYNYEIDMRDGQFPLLTTKKMSWKNILFENLWFLGGDSSNRFFEKHGIKFWKPWEDPEGHLPEAYGEYWRLYPNEAFGDYYDFDQFRAIIAGLKTNPNSRRLVLTNWFPPKAWNSNLPPCHLMAIFNVQSDIRTGKQILCLHLTQRSCDVALGVPYNIAGYAFILSLVSHLVDIPTGFFAHTLVDAHIYVGDSSSGQYSHLNGLKTQIMRIPNNLPVLKIDESEIKKGSGIVGLDKLGRLIMHASTEKIMNTFKILNYNCHPAIKFKVAV